MWTAGAASSMWPMRSRRTFERVTSTPQRSQMMPLNRMRLYLPQAHSQSLVGTENLLAEQAVLLGLERAVVDGLWLLDLAVRPGADRVGRGQADSKLIEVVDVQHVLSPTVSPSRRVRLVRGAASEGRLRRCPARGGQVDTEFLGGPEDVFVELAHLDLLAVVESTSTLRHSACISLMSTLKLSGMPGSGMFSPLTMAS